MKFATCNEYFENWAIEDVFSFAADLGYDVLLVAGQPGLDRGDPMNFAHHVLTDRLVAAPAPAARAAPPRVTVGASRGGEPRLSPCWPVASDTTVSSSPAPASSPHAPHLLLNSLGLQESIPSPLLRSLRFLIPLC